MRNSTFSFTLALTLLGGCASSPEGEAKGSYDPHTMRVLLGGSFDREGDGPAVGVNYEFRESSKLGFLGFSDVAFGHDTSTVVGGGIAVHPADRWTLFAGPGVEFAEGDADFIARVGGWYDFPIEKYTLSPTAWLDLGDGAAFLIGLSFGFRR